MPTAAKRCIASVIVAAGALASGTGASAATAVVQYSPFGPAGALATGLRAIPRSGGTCSTGSFIVAGPTVFRCFAGDRIWDPCYLDALRTDATRTVVVCARAPWATTVTRLRLASVPDPGLGAAPGGPPWALRLASGRRCVVVTGATTFVDGRRLSYGCEGGRVLFGRPDATRPTWRIRQARSAGGADMRRVSIAVAWG
jgi:hypothetical protein